MTKTINKYSPKYPEIHEVGYIHGIFGATDLSAYNRFRGERLRSYLVGFLDGYGYRNPTNSIALPLTPKQYEIISRKCDRKSKWQKGLAIRNKEKSKIPKI
jgi:hypothetical protein